MKPISPTLPSSQNIDGVTERVYGANQPEYRPLPAAEVRYGDGNITVVTRWQLSWRERIRLLFRPYVWVEQMTFGQPLQPQRLTINEPLTPADKDDDHDKEARA